MATEKAQFRFRTSGEGTPCKNCTAQENKTGTLEDLVKAGAIPPLHPNCRCRLEKSQSAILPKQLVSNLTL